LADTRTPAHRWLGDPPPERSALAQRNLLAGPDRHVQAMRGGKDGTVTSSANGIKVGGVILQQ